MNKYLYMIPAICCLAFLPATTAARELPFLHYTRDNGLPGNIVYSIYRDHKGLLWFATDRGVTRYNGIHFETFTTHDGLPDNEIFIIREDADNRCWFMSFTGALSYYRDGVFYNTGNSPFLRRLSRSYINGAMQLEQDSSFSIYPYDNNYLLNIRGEHYLKVPLQQINARMHVRKRIVASRKLSAIVFEIICDRQRFRIDVNGNILSEEPLPFSGHYNPIMCGQENHYLTADAIYNTTGQVTQRFPKGTYPLQSARCYLSDGKNLLVGTEDGLVINHTRRLLTGKKITAITTDAAGNYWISTLLNGVYCLNQDLQYTQVDRNCFSGVARFAFTDKGVLFFVTDNNNFYRSSKGRTALLLDYRALRGHSARYRSEPGFFLDDSLVFNSLYGHDHLLISRLHTSVPVIQQRYIPTEKTAKPHASPMLSADGIKFISATPGWIYFVYTGSRIFRIDRAHSARTGVSELTSLPLNPSGKRIYAMAKDAAQQLWYTTIDSMFKITGASAVNLPQFNNMAFKRFYIYDSCLIGWTHQNKLLICHDIYGKVKTDSVTGHNTIWNRAYRLNRSRVLLKTSNQYRMITLLPSGYRIHTVEHPFIPEEADYVSADSSTCYFLRNGHITSIPLQQLLIHTVPPVPVFMQVKVQDSVYAMHSGHIHIPYHARRNITVSFTAPGFGHKQLAYEYSVSGQHNDNWQELNEEKINLLAPAYGVYTIKVRSKSLSGERSAPAMLQFTITPPFWASWWFMLAAVLSALLLLYLSVRYLIKYFLRKREQVHITEMKFLQSEFKVLNALMNPHFIFNSLNNIQGLINDDNKRTANEYLRIFADLVRQNMLNISQERITLQKEMDLVTNYLRLEKLRFKDSFNYSIEMDENVDPDFIRIPPLLIQPLVENSIRHGLLPRPHPDNLVHIRIYEEDDLLLIEVRDNGIGIGKSLEQRPAAATSFALGNMEKRLAKLKTLHQQHITFHIRELPEQAGTIAVIRIYLDPPEAGS
ncbi:sensor histidine kinase [Chitinophaga solisilvae]|uniref:sensor histidine kinase n=1 Tax=Chitinophaga solisilvae TaxID=1233460 RepID=UPI00137134F1|nr:histidine kinase [Chitinophaga solisilvae]